MCVFNRSKPRPVSKPVLGGMARMVVKPAPTPKPTPTPVAKVTPKPVATPKAVTPVAKTPAPKAVTPVAKTPAPTPTPKPKAETQAPKKKSRRFVKSGGMIGGSRGSLQIPTGSTGNLRY